MENSKQQADKELADRELARRRLKYFAEYTYDGYMSNWHTDTICEALEAVERGDIRFLFIEAPPRHSKSLHVSQLFPAWAVGRNKDVDVIVSSYSGDLATTHGRETRNLINSKKYKNVFQTELAADSTAKGKWNTDGKGAYNAVGVGGSTTGKGAKYFIVDDSLKDRKEAESEVVRNGVWDWFRSVARTRLTPDGAMIVMQCMVGDTSVLMADGSKKKLKDVKKGDYVATYENGGLNTAKVTKQSKQGIDCVFAITTKSGKITRANERHPFLIKKDNKLQWVKLKDLSVGNHMLAVHGQAKPAPSNHATSQLNAKDTATVVTDENGGEQGTDPHPLTHDHIGTLISSADTGSQLKITNVWKQSKEECVQSANSHQESMCVSTGKTNCVSTIAMKLKKFVGYYATTATLLLGTAKQKTTSSEPLNTSDFILDEILEIKPDGKEDVFDLTVEGTENFIADGVVSHNTRWHLDDIIGRLLDEDPWVDWWEYKKKGLGDAKWVRLKLPAFATEKEPNRVVGDPLWPERYDRNELEDIKSSLGPYEFSALYQQSPVSSGNQEFNPNWYKYKTHTEMEVLPRKFRFLTVDTAVSQKDSADYTAFVDNTVGMDNKWHFKAWKQRITPDVLIEELFAIHATNKYDKIGIEETVFSMAIKPFLDQEMRKRDIYLPIVPLKHNQTQKEVRIRALIPRYASESIYHVEGECSELEFEQSVFPFGAHDDVLDAAAYQVQIVNSGSMIKPTQKRPNWGGTNKLRKAPAMGTNRYE